MKADSLATPSEIPLVPALPADEQAFFVIPLEKIGADLWRRQLYIPKESTPKHFRLVDDRSIDDDE